jgi:hypothetical protein
MIVWYILGILALMAASFYAGTRRTKDVPEDVFQIDLDDYHTMEAFFTSVIDLSIDHEDCMGEDPCGLHDKLIEAVDEYCGWGNHPLDKSA